MTTTFTVFSLGQLDIWDPVVGDAALDTAAVSAALVTYGTSTDPLYTSRQVFSPAGSGFGGGAATSYDIDNNTSNDQFSIDGGAVQTHDATMAFNATITYMDGTTATITAVVFQDTDGNSYWAPEFSANADQAAIDAQAIRYLELVSPIYGAATTDNGYNLTADRQDSAPLCLSKGTLIGCPNGDRLIERLMIGDLVATRDRGAIPIRWIGCRRFGQSDFKKNPMLLPVRILAGALGDGRPVRDLVVSRQHRVLVQSKIAERMFGEAEVLIPAIKLTALPGIFVDEAVTSIEYFHVLFDGHEVIYAEGSPTESLFPGPEALKSVSFEARQEILWILPELAELGYVTQSARLIPSRPQQKEFVARHLKNRKALIGKQKRSG
jgi:hypothetical protein